MSEFEISGEYAGKRLDRVLREIRAGLSLRAIRRSFLAGHVYLNGQLAQAAHKARPGDRLELKEAKPDPLSTQPRLLELASPYCCFWKPAGMHSVKLAGSDAPSLEGCIAELLPDKKPCLLQRLDFGTSGLVCAALDKAARNNFRQAEKEGLCKKFYYALLEGRLESSAIIKAALDVRQRKKTRVLQKEGERTTFIEPVEFFGPRACPYFKGSSERGSTLVRCELGAGSRHQIRAHAAHIGHPLAGDALYGSHESGKFMLEHFRLEFPGHLFQLPVDLSIFSRNK